MSSKDPELSQLGEALSEARAAYSAAKKVTDGAKEHLNETGDRIQSFNTKINELKQNVDHEYNEMRSMRAEGNREEAEEHRHKAQSMQEELTARYEGKKQCFGELDAARAAFNKALDNQKRLRDEMQTAWDAFNARLAYLKQENEKERAKWLETTCRECGKRIRYHKDRKKAPALCKECYEKDKVNWEDRQCARCGATFRINKNWEHIPTICSDCRTQVREEKEKNAAKRRAAKEAVNDSSEVPAEPAGTSLIDVAFEETDAITNAETAADTGIS